MKAYHRRQLQRQAVPALVEPDSDTETSAGGSDGENEKGHSCSQRASSADASRRTTRHSSKRRRIHSPTDLDTAIASNILVSLSQMPSPILRPLVQPYFALPACPLTVPVSSIFDPAIDTAGGSSPSAAKRPSSWNRLAPPRPCLSSASDDATSTDDSRASRATAITARRSVFGNDNAKRTALATQRKRVRHHTAPFIGRPLPAAPVLPNVAAGEIVL